MSAILGIAPAKGLAFLPDFNLTENRHEATQFDFDAVRDAGGLGLRNKEHLRQRSAVGGRVRGPEPEALDGVECRSGADFAYAE
ncbi:hypothetical protein D3C72_1910870 [compost metagenome]